MEIKAASQAIPVAPPVVTMKPVSVEHITPIMNQLSLSAVQNSDDKHGNGATDGKRVPSENELTQVTDELNNFMEKMHTDIKFAWHYKTNQLIVQVEDSKTHKVLKEFPAHEVLDTVARMKDYVGGLVDKKA